MFPIQFENFHSVLCLDGSLPDESFFKGIDLPIIAADGAANKLVAIGITPDYVIGDLDSLNQSLLETLNTVHLPDQDFCDYQKSLAYMRDHDLLPTIVCGVNGGALDHIINNINIFLNSGTILYAPPLFGYVLSENKKMNHTLPLYSKISILGIPSAVVSSSGLRWELDKYAMTFPGKNSCFNEVAASEIHLEVHEGKALVLIYF
jgi:thiamine pyrophosphokinase